MSPWKCPSVVEFKIAVSLERMLEKRLMPPGDDAQVYRNFDWQHFLFPNLPEIIPRKHYLFIGEQFSS